MKKLVVFSLNIKQNKRILTQLLYLKEALPFCKKDTFSTLNSELYTLNSALYTLHSELFIVHSSFLKKP